MEPGRGVEAELLDDPGLIRKLLLRIGEMLAERAQRFPERRIFGAQRRRDPREAGLLRPSRPQPGHPQNREQRQRRSEEHTSELQSLMRIPYAVFCLKKKNKNK